VRFRIPGPLWAEDVEITAQRDRIVVAMLLLHASRIDPYRRDLVADDRHHIRTRELFHRLGVPDLLRSAPGGGRMKG
jgi:hypothetical protein